MHRHQTIYMKVLYLLSGFILGSDAVFAQEPIPTKLIGAMADSLYASKNYLAATRCYIARAEAADFKWEKSTSYYNAACCLSLQQKKDSAFTYLKKAISAGYNNKKILLTDADFVALHPDSRWSKIVNSVKKQDGLNDDPAKARFVTDDIHRFWKAYHKAQKDTSHYKAIFKREYFDKSTRGMDDYMALKVNGFDAFITHIRSAPKFYASIEKNTLAVDAYKENFLKAFQAFKRIYPAAKFPDVYFVIGAFTSAGTVSDEGLLIGLNQTCQTDDTPVDEFNFRLRTRMNKLALLPYVIPHEMIHFQQSGLKSDTTTLKYAIVEGMADFLGELVSGGNPNAVLYKWAEGKERTIWDKFKKDMFLNKYDNWIGNSSQATPDNLPDQGYWVGYQICKAYYDKALDKQKAVNEMLHIQDYKLFLEQSGWEQKVPER